MLCFFPFSHTAGIVIHQPGGDWTGVHADLFLPKHFMSSKSYLFIIYLLTIFKEGKQI